MTMTLRDDRPEVIEQLTREHARSPWHGPARSDVLRDVDASMASRHPVPGAHSIWELVLHMTAWTREVERRLQHGVAGNPPEGDWPAVDATSAAAWSDALRALDEAHAAVLATIAALDPSAWDAPVRDPRQPTAVPETRRSLAWGLVQHDVYHTGQIALLKRAAQTSPESTRH